MSSDPPAASAPPPPAPAPPPAGGRSRRPAAIPAFALYGEEPVPAGDVRSASSTLPASSAAARPAQMLHIEEIQSRSRLYHWEIDPHVHRGLYQVLWVRRGHAQAALDEARADCRGPGAIVVPPGVVHAFRFAPETDGLVLTFGPRLLMDAEQPAAAEAMRALFAHSRVLRLAAPEAPVQRLDALLGELAAAFAEPGTDDAPLPLWLARAAVWRLARISAELGEAGDAAGARGATAQPVRADAAHGLYTRYLALVEAHYLAHWPVSRYASRLGASTDRLNRAVRTHGGMSAQALLHERLAREACRRLIYIAAPISRLAFELGFEDPAYFCRFFKRCTGASPSDWRAQHQPPPT